MDTASPVAAGGRTGLRVAVVGGGIAGTGAAWSLKRAGMVPTLYEKKPRLGGNAKQHVWDVEGQKVATGLAVLEIAWPEEYFHTYNALMKELKVETEFHELKYCILKKKTKLSSMEEAELVFAHGQVDKFEDWLKEDLKKWAKLVSFVVRTNAFFSPCDYPSLYRVNFANPLNMIPLRFLALNVYGISQKFWEMVFVPIHTSTFIEVEMSNIPAFMADILEGIVPLTRIPAMRTWKTTAFDVMQEMTKGWPKGSVRTACGVEKVEFKPRTGDDKFAYDVIVHDENGDANVYDAVIFACSAPAMNRALHGVGKPLPGQEISENLFNGLNPVMSRMEESMLSNIMYTTDRDKIFPKGIVHSDAEMVIPSKFKDYVLNEVCNLMIVPEDTPEDLENTFVISSWAPTLNKPGLKGKRAMLVTYGGVNAEKVDAEWAVTSQEAHPVLNIPILASSALAWPLFQGTRGGQCYFCASSVTPGNGHDLSLLSGLVAAAQLGAPFPFQEDKRAMEDYIRLRDFMLRYTKSRL